MIKFIYSEKVAKFCEVSTIDLSYLVPVKSTVEISQTFVAYELWDNLYDFTFLNLKTFKNVMISF